MGNYDPVDFYQTDLLLTAEEKDIRDTVRRFADEECLPIIADFFDRGAFPMDLIPRMAQLELFGVHVEGYGCRKKSHLIYGIICEELARCDSGLRAMFSVQNSLVMFPVFKFGSAAQREKWLPVMARGETIGCFGLSEPDYGSNPAGMQTTAIRKDGQFILNGKKMWITNGTIADVALIWARLDNEIRGFALKRQVFDQPIASFQLVQDQLVRMLVEITKAQLVSRHLGRMLDEHRAGPARISLAKLNNVREAIKIARTARDILGARGILADHHVIRHLCDLEAISTLEGTAGMHTLVLGQEITGISAFK
jgi:alkylation response protein AidB-like acyl-CoA dehydrogenase